MVKKRVVKSKRTQGSGSSVPLGVQIISILAYVLAVFSLLVVVFRTAMSPEELQRLITSLIEDGTASTTIASNFVVGGIFGTILFLVFAILMFFVGRGLWKGQKWARIVMIVLAAVGFLGDLADVLRGDVLRNLADLIINGIVAGYLLFNKKVKASFR